MGYFNFYLSLEFLYLSKIHLFNSYDSDKQKNYVIYHSNGAVGMLVCRTIQPKSKK